MGIGSVVYIPGAGFFEYMGAMGSVGDSWVGLLSGQLPDNHGLWNLKKWALERCLVHDRNIQEMDLKKPEEKPGPEITGGVGPKKLWCAFPFKRPCYVVGGTSGG